MESQSTKFTTSFIAMGIIMSSKAQKKFKRFTHLGIPKFSSVIGEDAYEFLIGYRDKLHNLE